MKESDLNQSLEQLNSRSNNEIDLKQLFESLSRNKLKIAKITAIIFITSGLYAFIKKPVWEAQFQIVLENNDSGNSKLAQFAALNPMLSNLAGVSGEDSLKTEVKILESPSILKPIFDFVRNYKAEEGQNVDKLRFVKWRKKNVSVNLEKGTSVLNISYRDTSKKLVLPVIERISEAYQVYSGRDRTRGLSQGVNYLQEQLTKLRPQANQSMRAAQAFALSNGLGLQDGIPVIAAVESSGAAADKATSVEASREAMQNKVNALQEQLNAARAARVKSVYVAPQLSANAGLYSKLQSLESQLQEKKALLRDKDPSIQTLQRQIRSLTQVINDQTTGLLQGQLQTAKAELISLTRPRNVVLKHKELVRTALRDEKTVTELESQLQRLKLEKARQTDPWELISTPTLLDEPVSPRKVQVMLLGLFAGLVIGSGVSLVMERRTDLVFSDDELKSLLPYPMLEHLPLLVHETWTDAADLLASGPLSDIPGNNAIALIPLGNMPSRQLKAFGAEISRALNGRQLLISADLRQTKSCASQILITAPGVATRAQISQLRQKLALQGVPIAGWVLLDAEYDIR